MQTITLFVHVAFENAKFVYSPIQCWCLAAWFVQCNFLLTLQNFPDKVLLSPNVSTLIIGWQHEILNGPDGTSVCLICVRSHLFTFEKGLLGFLQRFYYHFLLSSLSTNTYVETQNSRYIDDYFDRNAGQAHHCVNHTIQQAGGSRGRRNAAPFTLNHHR